MSADGRGLHGGGYTEQEGGGVVDYLIALSNKQDNPPPFPSSACGFSTAAGAGIDQNLEDFFFLDFSFSEDL